MTHQRTALLSVYDKDGIVEFAQGLIALGWRVLSTGGTAKHLVAADVPVTDIAQITHLPPVLSHRVVSLVPQVHGGLLATDDHLEELAVLGWPKIDLVCVDLYPLEQEIASAGATRDSVIEKTDIGGPTMLRSGAKGRRIVICDPTDRTPVLRWITDGCPNADAYITELCAKAEGVIAEYCLASARYHSKGAIDGLVGTCQLECKYGENPGWQASLYATSDDPLGVPAFVVEAGTAPSFINIADIDRALRTLIQISAGFEVNLGTAPKIAIAVKHGNACGAAVDADAATALQKMIQCDPTSIHGATVLTNFAFNAELAATLREHLMTDGRKRLIDVVVAPSFDDGAEAALERKAGKCRVIANPRLATVTRRDLPRTQLRPVRNGFLRQWGEPFVLDFTHPLMELHGSFGAQVRKDLILAWAIGSTSTSNTITLVKDGMLVANAVGQQSRVRAAKLALMIATESSHDVRGAVAYSDSFFPFADGPTILVEAGIRTIFASSGSINDDTVLEAVRQADVNFARLPDKVCRGFFQH